MYLEINCEESNYLNGLEFHNVDSNAHSERDAADLQQRADLMKLLIITGCMLQKNSKVQHQHHCIPTEMKLQMHKTQINTHKL